MAVVTQLQLDELLADELEFGNHEPALDTSQMYNLQIEGGGGPLASLSLGS